MILTDYFRSVPDLTWDYALQCGVNCGTIRLPEDPEFDPANRKHWLTVYQRFQSRNIRPMVLEPIPNCLHDHIKAGDEQRDACLDAFLRMLPIMDELDIRLICVNFMAHVGWTRTTSIHKERGGALVTGFNLADYVPGPASITEDQLWENYTYFIKAVVPEAEKYGIRLAIHPDAPPLPKLGNVSRILISLTNMERAVTGIVQSPSLGYAMCQATYHMMGESLETVIPKLADKIFFIHFRNVSGTKTDFRETMHDNGELDMAHLMQLYHRCGVNVPIRVDHVPTMAGENVKTPGYDTLGRLFALGYLKGILDSVEKNDG